MKVHDLNIMESEFLEALDYNLFVREHEYGIWKQLLQECRDRATQMSYYTVDFNPQQRQQLILLTLQTLGLYQGSEKTVQPQHYQHFLPTSNTPSSQLPFNMQPPVGYNSNSNNYYNNNSSYYNNNIACGTADYPITNLSQSSWDPLAYSLNRCQDYSYYSNSSQNSFTSARPISWRNFS
jgi:hypothetical protein